MLISHFPRLHTFNCNRTDVFAKISELVIVLNGTLLGANVLFEKATSIYILSVENVNTLVSPVLKI